MAAASNLQGLIDRERADSREQEHATLSDDSSAQTRSAVLGNSGFAGHICRVAAPWSASGLQLALLIDM